jgi:hypothetical protein
LLATVEAQLKYFNFVCDILQELSSRNSCCSSLASPLCSQSKSLATSIRNLEWTIMLSLDDQLEASRRGKTIKSIKGQASDTNLWFMGSELQVRIYIHILQLRKYYKGSMLLMAPRTHAPAWWPGKQSLGINALKSGG